MWVWVVELRKKKTRKAFNFQLINLIQVLTPIEKTPFQDLTKLKEAILFWVPKLFNQAKVSQETAQQRYLKSQPNKNRDNKELGNNNPLIVQEDQE